jgi:hypothetical protein
MGVPDRTAPWGRSGARRALLVVAPLAGLLAVVLLARVHLDAYLWATGEDGPVEWATVACYLLAAVGALALAARWRHQERRVATVAYLILSIGFIFIAGEEVSWGQRVLGFDGPDALVERNLQDEANLHNLLGRYALHAAYIVVALWGVGVGRWLARRITWLRPPFAFAPSSDLRWWFAPVLAYYVYVDYVVPLVNAVSARLTVGEGPPRLQEPVELVLAAGFLLFVVEVWRQSSRTSPRDEPSGSSGSRRRAEPAA